MVVWGGYEEDVSPSLNTGGRYDPETGEIGPLAVWSQEALKDQVTTPATPADAATDRNAKGVDSQAGPDKEGSR